MMENCFYCHAESRITGITMMPFFFRHWRGSVGLAVRAFGGSPPSDFFQMVEAIIMSRKDAVNFDDVHFSTSLWDIIPKAENLVKRNLLP